MDSRSVAVAGDCNDQCDKQCGGERPCFGCNGVRHKRSGHKRSECLNVNRVGGNAGVCVLSVGSSTHLTYLAMPVHNKHGGMGGTADINHSIALMEASPAVIVNSGGTATTVDHHLDKMTGQRSEHKVSNINSLSNRQEDRHSSNLIARLLFYGLLIIAYLCYLCM